MLTSIANEPFSNNHASLPTPDLSLPCPAWSIPDTAERLFCQLEGFVVVEVTGDVDVEWIDRGNAYIHNARTIRLYGEGQRLQQLSWSFLLDWHGKFRTSGIRHQVQIGGATAFTVIGEGSVRARGKGYCTVNGNKIQLTSEFQEVSFG